MRTTIKDFEFVDNKKLTEYVIPDGVTEIGIYAFFGCTGLKSVTIPRGCRYKDAFNDTTEVIIR